MRRALTLLLVLAMLPVLVGWKFLNPPRKWAGDGQPGQEDALPIRYRTGDQTPFGMNDAQKLELVQRAYDAWGDVPCSSVRAEHVGVLDNEPNWRGPYGYTMISFEGNLDTGTNAAAKTFYNNDSVVPYNGVSFKRITSMEVIFNSGIRWGGPEAVRASDCFNVNSFLATGIHEFGHGLGFGHSCEGDEPCPEASRRLATMYYAGARCDGSREDLNEDDMAATQAAYGAAVDFALEGLGEDGLVGSAPLDVEVTIPEEFVEATTADGASLRFTQFEVNFGDGSEHVILPNDGSVLPVTHTYTEEAQYTVSVTAHGDDAACGGEFEAERRQVAAVLVCAPPKPGFESSNLGDNRVELVNTTPLGAFGCITQFTWILDGDEEGALSTYEPTWTFDEPGSHTVTLRTSGHGGSEEFTADVEVTAAADGGCAASVGGRSGGFFGLLLLGLLRKRR